MNRRRKRRRKWGGEGEKNQTALISLNNRNLCKLLTQDPVSNKSSLSCH